MKMPGKKKDIIVIWWYDAVSMPSREQTDAVNNLQLAVNCNIGWIMHENELRIVLCHGNSNTGELDHYLIPTANIMKRKLIFPKG